MPGIRLLELLIEVVLEAMRGQTPEQKARMWDWYIRDVERWRKLLKLDDETNG